MRRLAALVLALWLPLAAGADDEPPEPPEPGTMPVTGAAAPAPPAVLGQGLASWYGRAFQGRRTASGERFDMHALTAAHPSLPFGSRVVVRDLRNGRQVVVRINDRGPFLPERIIDVSHAAARALGLLGIGPREVELLEPGPEHAGAAAGPGQPPAAAPRRR